MQEQLAHLGVKIIVATHFAEGGKGALEVAKEVVRLCEQPNNFRSSTKTSRRCGTR